MLLGRRSDDCDWLPGAWDVFGGHLEPGEDELAALRRELGEELGIVPRRWRRLATLAADAPDPWRLDLYVVTAWDGTPANRQPDEHAELRWCGLAEAQARLRGAHPGFAALLADALAPAGEA